MKTIPWNPDTPWDDVLRQAEQEEIVLVRDGHAVALVVPFGDEDLEWYARERDPQFLASLARARQQVREGQTIRHADLKRELGVVDSKAPSREG